MPTARSSIPAPLPGCTPLFDSAALREADRRAGEDHAMPSILLMERAGLATAEAVLAEFGAVRAARVVVGSGNNGGDGLVVARHLADAGWDVQVMAPGDPPGTPDAATMAAESNSGVHPGSGAGIEDRAVGTASHPGRPGDRGTGPCQARLTG